VLDAARIANLAAGVAVSRIGTATVTIEDVLHQIEDSTSGSRKILTREELAALLPPTRSKQTIVFTNGFLTFCMSDISRCSAIQGSGGQTDRRPQQRRVDSPQQRRQASIVSERERAHILPHWNQWTTSYCSTKTRR